MSVQRTTELPTELESPRAKFVYLYLQSAEASIDDIQADLGVQKITPFSILRTLQELIERWGRKFAVLESLFVF